MLWLIVRDPAGVCSLRTWNTTDLLSPPRQSGWHVFMAAYGRYELILGQDMLSLNILCPDIWSILGFLSEYVRHSQNKQSNIAPEDWAVHSAHFNFLSNYKICHFSILGVIFYLVLCVLIIISVQIQTSMGINSFVSEQKWRFLSHILNRVKSCCVIDILYITFRGNISMSICIDVCVFLFSTEWRSGCWLHQRHFWCWFETAAQLWVERVWWFVQTNKTQWSRCSAWLK